MHSSSVLSPSLKPEELTAFANQIIKDPKLLEQLTDRVHDLFQENLRHQHEQLKHYKYGRGLV